MVNKYIVCIVFLWLNDNSNLRIIANHQFTADYMNLYIGLMSGTSMDGIDAALVDVDNHKLIHGITKPYSLSLQKRLSELTAGSPVPIASFCQANSLIGEAFAEAVNELLAIAQVPLTSIKAIGSHGQTIAHDIRTEFPYTLQLGCGHTIAHRTGIPVVADFRTRDLVLGGQGAPFAPLYHHEVFATTMQLPIAVVNIGGIANISLLTDKNKTQGWDLGPGNCLMDAWINKQLGHNYDCSGAWASQGKVITSLFEQLQKDTFFKQKPPKSLGKEYYSLAWLEKYLSENRLPVDVQATLLALTGWCIADAIDPTIKQLLICGGGAHNNALMTALEQLLPETIVQSTDDVGISSDYLEAMMFAWLASQTIMKKKVDLTHITGSKAPQLLGAIYMA
jgi:anhydro-N-acetylmuramic acid kinase